MKQSHSFILKNLGMCNFFLRIFFLTKKDDQIGIENL